MKLRSRDAWLTALAATLGISEEACRKDAAPQVQQVATASASASASASPSATIIVAETAPSTTASTSTSASARTAAKNAPTSATMTPEQLAQAICGAVPQNVLQQSGACGVSANPMPMPMASGTVGTIGTGHNPACGASPMRIGTNTNVPRAEVNLTVHGNAADQERAKALRPRFRACANQALAQDPTQRGQLTIMATIGKNGEVTKADIANNAGLSASSAQCMLRGVRVAQFAAGDERTLVVMIVQTAAQSP